MSEPTQLGGLAVTVSGAGAPLFLLHGIGSHRGVFDPVVARLAAVHTVYAVDLPGFGESPVLPGSETPDAPGLAAAVARAMDDAGLDRAHLCGNSLGGWVALELARLRRASSVTGLSPAGFWTAAELRRVRLTLRASHALARAIGPRAERLFASPKARARFGTTFQARPAAVPGPEFAASIRALAAAPGWTRTLARLDVSGFQPQSVPPLPAHTPLTLLWGDRDELLVPRQAETARAVLPQARVELLPGVGHVPFWDDPDVVATAVLRGASHQPTRSR